MKIRNKILLYSLGITIVSLLFVMADSFYNVDSIIVKNAESKLESIANIQRNRTEAELNNYETQAGLVASRTALTKETANYNTNNDPETAETIKSIILDAKKSVSDFEAIYILDKSAKTIAGTDAVIIETKIENKKITSSKENIQTYIFDDSTPIKDLLIIAPIKKDNSFQGYAVVVINSNSLQKIMNDYSGLGETGETTIGYKNKDGDAQFIRPPRFSKDDSNIVISKTNTSVAMVEALAGVEHLEKDGIDYRDKTIYAATKYIQPSGWGIVVKIDKAELYKPIYSHAIQLGSIGLFLIILIIIFSLNIANGIARPIEKLKEGTKEISKGDFGYNIVINSNDEIGDLSRSFNSMTEAIIASRAEVDQKVKDQTSAIFENQTNLENQRKAILNILEDVEEEKNLTAREKDKIETILQSIGDAVFVVDTNLNIILANQVAIDISGLKREEIIGKKYTDVFHFVFENENPKLEKVNDKFVKDAIATGKVQEMSNHTVLISAKSERIPVSDSSAPLKDKDGKIIGCVVVFRDVSKEYAIDKAKTEFVSLASHQLRTPLSAINWYTEMLMNGDVGKMTPEQEKYLQEIYHGNQRMVDLVNALLNTSRIELGTFAIEPIMMDIVKSTDEIVKEMQIPAKEKKIELATNYKDKLPQILADPKIYQIIIQNLLSNAVKYTPDKGKASLTISKNDSNILIEVKDTGYGIPKAQQKEIFNKLFRADNVRAKDTEGTGLGLYIVKSIVEQSGGKIWFESAENKGTTFFVTFPLSGMIKKTGTKALEDIK